MADVETRADPQASKPTALVGLAIAAMVVLAGLLFVLARHLDWTLGWIYVGIIVVTVAINLACVRRWNPGLIRQRVGFRRGSKTWDVVWLALFTAAVSAIYVVALLEPRDEEWRAPGAAWLAGLAIFAPGWALIIWSMVVNPFFEKTVRIQTDRGHRVIDSGPYAYVRHPGYVGFLGWILSTPLLLPSASAFLPALLVVILLVIRTALEDRTLHAELPGYAEYAARVRFRLIPGVW